MNAFLLDVFVKVTLLLVVAAGVSLMLRRAAAAYRHLVWLLACAGVLALPLASALIPDWRVRLWPRLDVPVAFDASQLAAAQPEPSAPVVEKRISGITAEPAAPTSSIELTDPAPGESVRWQLQPDWTALILPAWFAGGVLVLLLLAIGLARIAWLERVAEPVRDGRWIALARALERRLGLPRPVRLLRAAGPAMPMTWGVRRPVILLPAAADEWSDERRRDVLLHELAHVKRQDFLTQLIARLACAVYWFHPLVWLAATRLRVERERACDDHVLRGGTKPSDYASHLLDIARALRPAAATSLASVAMARPSQLATRLLDVLDGGRRRDLLSARAAAPAWLAALAIVVPLAALAPSVAEPAAVTASIDTMPRLPTLLGSMSERPRAAAPRSVAVIDSLRGCPEDNPTHRNSHYNIDNDRLELTTTIGSCTVHLSSDGKFTFNEDFTDVATITRGGYLIIEVDYGRTDRRLTLRPDNGGLSRVWRVDGVDRPYDAEARAWLADALTLVLRRTGFAAQERAQWILSKRGVQGLLDEIAELSGDYSRRIYYQAAIESGKLDVAGYERVVTEAGKSISSDYELAELLIAVSKAQPLTDRMQVAFVAAAKTISSDYECRRVLQAALSRSGLTTNAQIAMLEAASTIESDYELASLLIELHQARPVDDAVRPAFFRAVNSLQSDYEHRRVLTAVVERPGASRAILSDVLTSATSINSDYEVAELLIGVAESYVVDEALRPAYFAATNTIGSDYEHGRALKVLLAKGQLAPAVAGAIVESARGIASDYELAEVLLAVIEKVKPDDALQATIRSAVGTLQSSYERGRVLDALNRRGGRTELE